MRNNNQNIINAILSCNLTKIKSLVNEDNVNDVLDENSKYTAFHYAVSFQYTPIIRYLLSLDADYNMKDSENRTVFDISNDSIKKLLFYTITDKLHDHLDQTHEELDDISQECDDVKEKFKETKLNKNNLEAELITKNLELDGLNKKITQLKDNINKLQKDNNNQVTIISDKTNEVEKYKKRNLDAEQAFSNLLKKQRKN